MACGEPGAAYNISVAVYLLLCKIIFRLDLRLIGAGVVFRVFMAVIICNVKFYMA